MLVTPSLRASPSGPPVNWGKILGELGASVIADVQQSYRRNVGFPVTPQFGEIGAVLLEIPEDELALTTLVAFYTGLYQMDGATGGVETRLTLTSATVTDQQINQETSFQYVHDATYYARQVSNYLIAAPPSFDLAPGPNQLRVLAAGGTVAGAAISSNLLVARLLGTAGQS